MKKTPVYRAAPPRRRILGGRETLPHESAAAETFRFTPATAPEIRFVGRAARSDDGALSFDWSGSYFSFRFEYAVRHAGRRLETELLQRIRGRQTPWKGHRRGPAKTIVLAEGLPHGVHTVLVQKRTEGEQGRTTLFAVGSDGPLLDAPQAPDRHIEFIGDSHTCGYGTEGKSPKEPFTPETENCDLAWGCIIARYFDADYTLIAHSGQGIVRNWGDEKESLRLHHARAHDAHLRHGGDAPLGLRAVPARHRGNQTRIERLQRESPPRRRLSTPPMRRRCGRSARPTATCPCCASPRPRTRPSMATCKPSSGSNRTPRCTAP